MHFALMPTHCVHSFCSSHLMRCRRQRSHALAAFFLLARGRTVCSRLGLEFVSLVLFLAEPILSLDFGCLPLQVRQRICET